MAHPHDDEALNSEKLKDFHLEQYKMLREEILEHQREINRTFVAGTLALGAIYGWFLTKPKIPYRAAWFIAPGVVLLCIIEITILSLRIGRIGRYLLGIEATLIPSTSRLPGWEHFFVKYSKSHLIINAVIGILVLGGSIWASWMFSK